MWDKAADNCLAALKFVLDWFDTSKMIKKLFTDLYANLNMLFNKDSSNAVLSCNGMGENNWYKSITLILTIPIMSKMLLILLFLSDF